MAAHQISYYPAESLRGRELAAHQDAGKRKAPPVTAFTHFPDAPDIVLATARMIAGGLVDGGHVALRAGAGHPASAAASSAM
jgi:hypothetical protein